MTCPDCQAAGTDPYILTRGPGCMDCVARHAAIAVLGWNQPKHAPGYSRWDFAAKLLTVLWPDERQRAEGKRLVWRWVLKFKRAEVAQ